MPHHYDNDDKLATAKPQIEVNWENPPALDDLKQNMTDATEHHTSHVDQVNTWLDNLYVTGSGKQAFRKNRSLVTPKLIRKQAEWRYSSLSESFLSHEDLFTTEPVTWEDTDAETQNGLVLNNQFNTKLDKVNFIDEYVRAAVNEGTVILRLGWEFKEEEREVPNMVIQPISSPFKIQMVEQAAGMVMQGQTENIPEEVLTAVKASLEAGQPVEVVQDGFKMEMVTVKNQPSIEVCDYASVMVDPSCKGDIRKARFVIYGFETSLSDLEAENVDPENPRYQNLEKVNLERHAIAGDKTHTDGSHNEQTGAFNFKDKPRKRFTAYEYWGFWDIDGDGLVKPIVSTWVGDTMIRLEESPFPDRELPFVMAKYMPKRKDIYGEPDGELLLENQKIAGAVTRGMIDMMGRSAVGQTGYRKDALDVTNRRRFDEGRDYEYNAHVLDPRTAFHQHTFPDIPASAPFMLSLQNTEAESLTGVKAFSDQGISGEGLGRSATAARSALDAAGKRELGILRRLAAGIIECGRKITAMNAVWLEDEEVVRITNEEFVTIDRQDLSGKIDIKLKISTAEADDTKAQELAFMLQTTGPNSDPGEVRMIRAEIAKLRKMPELAKKIEEYQPEPDPLAVRLQELEIEEAEARIAKLHSEARENDAESELDLAKARQAQSDADLKDLDFVEKESGTQHERDVDKITSQADGNIRHEAVKAALSPDAGNKLNPEDARPS
jgi:hypothetical protein